MAEPVRFWHRLKKELVTEEIYGEGWLRFTYGNPLGKLALWLLVRRAFFSKYIGWRMNRRYSSQQVLPFIVKYDLDHEEFVKKPFAFKTFNEFFYRALKPDARPIAQDDRLAVLPADGRHLVFPNVDSADGFYVKGMKFTLAELFGNKDRAAPFEGGAMVISRLCPVDYHRFHFPVNGTPALPVRVNGWLYSVSPIALKRNVRYLVENERVITLMKSPEFGNVAVIEVGATCVGTIRQTHVPERPVKKGDEKGLFAFGGSCVITVFQPGRIAFDSDLVEQSANCIETYAKMGERLGVAR